MEIQPGLAEDYEQLDDNTWEFNLQENVRGKAYTLIQPLSCIQGCPKTSRTGQSCVHLVSNHGEEAQGLSAAHPSRPFIPKAAFPYPSLIIALGGAPAKSGLKKILSIKKRKNTHVHIHL
ncbi:hypothetical protein [Natribacillus halophilus]|nr:hypothetical protein [Natribacillus halophilus]